MTRSTLITPTARPPEPRRDTIAAAVGGLFAAAVGGYIAGKTAWAINPELSRQFLTPGWHALAGLKSIGDLLGMGWEDWASQYTHATVAAGWSAWWRIVSMWTVAGAAGVGTFILLNKKTDPVRHSRGRRRLEVRELAKLTRRVKSPAAEIDGIRLSDEQIAKGITAIGSSGAGKTQLIHRLWPQLKASGWRGLIVDGAKGDFSSASLYQDCEIIAPWHDGLAWDIGRDCTSRAAAIELAARIIPASDKDPMWGNAARMILTVSVCYLIATQGTGWGWGELWAEMIQPLQVTKERAAVYYPPAIPLLADAESKTTQSVLINMLAFAASIYELAMAWGNAPAERRISILSWLMDEGDRRSFILQANGEFSQTARGYIQGVVGLCSAAVISPRMSESKTRRTLILIDEAAQLGRLEGIEKFVEVGRGKTTTFLLATQSPSQLREVYGENLLATIYATVGLRFWMRTTGDADQQYVAAQIGKREVWTPQQNVNASAGGFAVGSSYSRDELWIVHPSELGSDLGPGAKGIDAIFDDGGNGLATIHFPFTKTQDARPVYAPNPAWNSLAGVAAMAAAGAGEGEIEAALSTLAQTSVLDFSRTDNAAGMEIYNLPSAEIEAEDEGEQVSGMGAEQVIDGAVEAAIGGVDAHGVGGVVELINELGGQEQTGEIEQVVMTKPGTKRRSLSMSRMRKGREQEHA